MNEYLSFDDLLAEPDVRYADVKTKRGLVHLASASSAEIIEWLAENEDPEKQKLSGLRLLSRCIMDGEGKRLGDGLPNDQKTTTRDEFVRKMAQRDSVENGVLARKALELNGLRPPSDITVEKALGNDSGGAPSDASPSGSPSPSVA